MPSIVDSIKNKIKGDNSLEKRDEEMKDSCQNTPKISDSQNQYEELK